MKKNFSVKEMINDYVEFMSGELMVYNTKIFSHWSDLSEGMKTSFREDFGEKTCKNFNYFIVIWSTNLMSWGVYLANDVFELMEFANCISNYYYSEDFRDFNEKLLQVQESALKHTIGGKDGKKA